MAKYTVNCSDCGTEMTVQLVGPGKDRDYKLNNWTWTCDDCVAKARAAAGAKAAAQTAELGLPPLTGSEKQIAWAEQIRATAWEKRVAIRSSSLHSADLFLKQDAECAGLFDEKTVEGGGRFKGSHIVKTLKADVLAMLEPLKDQIISETEARFFGVDSARWWIDARDQLGEAFAKSVAKTIKIYALPKVPETTPEAQAAKEELMLVPDAETITSAICEICVSETVVVHLPEKIEAFRLMVKAAGFCWEDGAWRNKGALKEQRAAWVGYNALALGIRVAANNAVVAAIKSGSVHGQWVSANADKGLFFLRWWAGDWYERCKRLPGARWDKPFFKVPLKYAAEVADFAATEGWGVSEGAQKAIAAGLKTETVHADLPDQNPQGRQELKADDFGVSNDLRD